MILGYYGRSTSLDELRAKYTGDARGSNLEPLLDLFESLNLSARAVSLDIAGIIHLPCPAILHLDFNHFVVLKKVTRRGLVIHDPRVGLDTLSFQEVDRRFTGVAIELIPNFNFQKVDAGTKISLQDIVSKATGIWSSVFALVSLTFVFQIFALVIPYYSQIVLDEVVINRDESLLFALLLAFSLILVFRSLTQLFRDLTTIRLGNSLTYQLGVGVFSRLVRLTSRYFERRHTGEVVTNFVSIYEIREMITTGLVSVVVDGILIVLTLVILFLYSSVLTVAVLVFVALNLLLRVGALHLLKNVTQQKLVASADESTVFLQILRNMDDVKIFGPERIFKFVWRERFSKVVRSSERLDRINAYIGTGTAFLVGVENLIVIFIGAYLIMGGAFTVGMLLAYIAYKQMFVSSAQKLIDEFLRFRVLDLYLDRLSDFGRTDTEQDKVSARSGNPTVSGRLKCENLHFSYDGSDNYLLRGIDFEVPPGGSIAITGPSGCGKSTLIKVVLGLLEPLKGVVRLDGHDIYKLGLGYYRDHVSYIGQNNSLMPGTLAQNIAFFDPNADLGLVKVCAELAFIDGDIEMLPMGYETVVGDIGQALSGGQLQRVQIARALYKQPKLIFFDEATNSLDAESERVVSENIKSLHTTRIIVSHRQETLATADRILSLQGGELT